MKVAFRQSMAWLHTWCGVLVGWALFFIFLTGTAGYFDTEIDRWMQPERPLVAEAMSTADAVASAVRRLQQTSPEAARWLILPPSGRENPQLRIVWNAYPKKRGERAASGGEYLDAVTREPVTYRRTGGGQLLYRMHYRLHYMSRGPAAWIVGVCTMFMLVAIVTGVIVHRKIFRDFFTFRPGIGQRSWLDAHNMLAVLALPFHAMITYTGLVFIMYLYMAPLIAATYGMSEQERKSYVDVMFSSTPGAATVRAGVATPLPALAPLLSEAERQWGPIRSVTIRHPGDRNVQVFIEAGEQTLSRSVGELRFDIKNGVRLLFDDDRSMAKTTVDALLGLHEGLFAGPLLRWLYFVSGLMGTAMIGAGLVLWTVKRRERLARDDKPSFGLGLVEQLNIGTIVGLPVAIAAYFWANRLIPSHFAERAAWEANTLFIVWALLLLHPIVRPVRRAWIEQLGLAAAAYALLPALNAITTDRHLGASVPAGQWDLAGFDLVMLAFGTIFAVVAWRLMRRAPVTAAGRARSYTALRHLRPAK